MASAAKHEGLGIDVPARVSPEAYETTDASGLSRNSGHKPSTRSTGLHGLAVCQLQFLRAMAQDRARHLGSCMIIQMSSANNSTCRLRRIDIDDLTPMFDTQA